MWSIMGAMIQTAHDKDPSVFHFADFVKHDRPSQSSDHVLTQSRGGETVCQTLLYQEQV